MFKHLFVFYLVVKGTIMLYSSPNINPTCEFWTQHQDAKVVFVTNEHTSYDVRCERIEEENVPIFGKWRFVML